MYHQFKQLADIDITKEAMEIGPTTHYMMGGVRVHPETQMSTLPGLFAAGEVAAGLHGANRLGGNSLSDLLVFGKRAGEAAAVFAKQNATPTIDATQVERAAAGALKPFERSNGENPYQIQHELQDVMQDLVGIVRRHDEMEQALTAIAQLQARAQRTSVTGNREYNPGWHTALDLEHLLTVSEAITRAALERKESRGAHFREDYPEKDPAAAKFNLVIARQSDGTMQVRREPVPSMSPEQQATIEEFK
jgi:succinate dehydrogenase / fumarate reductase flavoprotein subunit